MPEPNNPYVIVVGVDRSETGDLALEQALEIGARQGNAEVHAVTVVTLLLPPAASMEFGALAGIPGVPMEQAKIELDRHVAAKVAALRTKLGHEAPAYFPRVAVHLRLDVAAQEIAQLAADLEADLVVVGTHGRRGLSRVLMGSVAEAVVRLSPCPVLVVRPKRLVTVAVIEPPCSECVKTRQATQGAQFWCAQHSERHGQRHTYHTTDKISADGSMPLVFHE